MIASENYIYTNSKRECNIEYYQYYRRADAKATILSVATKGKKCASAKMIIASHTGRAPEIEIS